MDYARMKHLGYRSLVNEYYKSLKENKWCLKRKEKGGNDVIDC